MRIPTARGLVPLSTLAPYLEGIELGGIRVLQSSRYGTEEKYFAVDIDAQLDKYEPPMVSSGTPGKNYPRAIQGKAGGDG